MAAGYQIEKAIRRNRRVLARGYYRWGTEFADFGDVFDMKLLLRQGKSITRMSPEEVNERVSITISVDDVLAFESDEAYLEWIETEYAIRRVTQ